MESSDRVKPNTWMSSYAGRGEVVVGYILCQETIVERFPILKKKEGGRRMRRGGSGA